MNAYHGKDLLKMQYIQTALEHEQADSYVKGLYWAEAEKRGCNIGCWTKAENGKHEALALEMGVNVELLHLSDGLFEALPDPAYKSWSRRFAAGIEVGADLDIVGGKLLKWLLCDDQWGLKVLSGDSTTRCIFRDMGLHLEESWQSWRPAPPELEEGVDRARASLSAWRRWDDHALRGMRAIRASLEIWRCRKSDFKSLARAAWSSRAAWSAWEAYTEAQSEALLAMLQESPVLTGAA